MEENLIFVLYKFIQRLFILICMASVLLKKSKSENKTELKESANENEFLSEQKITVLQSHGYTLGKIIGSGSYATVKVRTIFII